VVSPPANSALYVGYVDHHRFQPEHRFRYRITMCLFDLDELEDVMALHPLWSASRGRPIQLRRTDYMGDSDVDLKVAAGRRFEESVDLLEQGSVRLLTQVRTWGWCFNPISIYYFMSPDDQFAGAIASVTNTPWGERYDYALEANDGRVDMSVKKALHVSPFIDMDRTYHFFISEPREQISVRIDVLEGQEVRLRTALQLTRQVLDRSAMTSLLYSYPFAASRVSAAIYWQAAQLWLKGAQFHKHPGPRSPVGYKS